MPKIDRRKTCSSHITLIFNKYTSYLVAVLNVQCITIYNIMILLLVSIMFYTVWVYEKFNYMYKKVISNLSNLVI